MRLPAYLERHGLSNTDFAARIGVSAEAVRRYAHGTRTPRPAVMARIAAATGGVVRPDDFFHITTGNTFENSAAVAATL